MGRGKFSVISDQFSAYPAVCHFLPLIRPFRDDFSPEGEESEVCHCDNGPLSQIWERVGVRVYKTARWRDQFSAPFNLRIVWSLLLASTFILLTSCTPADTQSTVSFAFAGDSAELAAYQTLIDAFEAEHPEITVQVRHAPSRQDFEQKLITMFDAGSPPDLVLLNYRRVARFAADGDLHPAGSDVLDEDLSAAFYPIAIDAFTHEGELWCVPQNISSLVVYINQDLFARAGLERPAADWTWDDFLQTAVGLNALGPEIHGAAIEPNLYRLAPFLWQAGGQIAVSGSDLLPPIPQNMQALTWFTELQTAHGVVPTQLEAQALSAEDRFLSGTVGMFFDSRRLTPILRQTAEFSWDVAPLPQGAQAAGVLHSDGYCLGQPPSAETLEFLRFAVSEEGQKIMAQTGRTVPSRISVANSTAFLDPAKVPASSHVWLDGVEQLELIPWHPAWVELEKMASAEIEQVFYGLNTPEGAIVKINTRAETILSVTP